MKLNKLIAIATISLLSGGISMAQKALNLEDIVASGLLIIFQAAITFTVF